MGAGLPQLWCILNAIYESLWQRCRRGARAPGSAARSDRKYSFHLSTVLPPILLLFLLFKKDYTSQRTLAKSLKTLRSIQQHLVESWSLEASLGQEAIKDSKFSFFLNHQSGRQKRLLIKIWMSGKSSVCPSGFWATRLGVQSWHQVEKYHQISSYHALPGPSAVWLMV